MAKHPVPKYKTPKSKTKTRYSAFARKKINKLEGLVNGAMHTFKKANDALKQKKQKKELDKIKKVKA
jgi:hypothetical protein